MGLMRVPDSGSMAADHGHERDAACWVALADSCLVAHRILLCKAEDHSHSDDAVADQDLEFCDMEIGMEAGHTPAPAKVCEGEYEKYDHLKKYAQNRISRAMPARHEVPPPS